MTGLAYTRAHKFRNRRVSPVSDSYVPCTCPSGFVYHAMNCPRTKELNRIAYPTPEESSVSDSSRVEIDASRDLATIRLRSATGHLYDIEVSALADRLIHDITVKPNGLIPFNLVPTWEGIPIPDDLRDGSTATEYAREMWRRGVTDANNATLNGEPK